jgi:hypothetical protein
VASLREEKRPHLGRDKVSTLILLLCYTSSITLHKATQKYTILRSPQRLHGCRPPGLSLPGHMGRQQGCNSCQPSHHNCEWEVVYDKWQEHQDPGRGPGGGAAYDSKKGFRNGSEADDSSQIA